MEYVEFKGKTYPKFQAEGNAAQFILPFANKLLTGIGFDIGCAKKEWAFPGAIPIDIVFEDGYHAYNLPAIFNNNAGVDYIFSSHCLEHLTSWVNALDYWISKIRSGGVLLLYLPHYSQEYWRPWNNRKHLHVLDPQTIKDYLESNYNIKSVTVTGPDLNNSFAVLAEIK